MTPIASPSLSERASTALRRAGIVARMAANAARVPKPVADPPLVSVVTATYNYSTALRYTIESVRGQSYPNLEHIVVGDGCTDDSEEVVASFGDPRIRWVGLPENTGSQSTPNNAGIGEAKGEFVAYLGHDDLWGRHHLTSLVSTALRTGAGTVHSLLEVIGPPGSGLRTIAGISASGRYEPGQWIGPGALMHRTELAQRVGGWRAYDEIDLPLDLEFLSRLANSGAGVESTRGLTAFKFPAVMRRDVYKLRPSHEQELQWARISGERAFALREVGRLLRARATEDLSEFERATLADQVHSPNGGWVKASRRIRGLPDLD